MTTSLSTQRLFVASIASAAMSLTGCALKPYVRAEGLQITLPSTSAASRSVTYAGDVAQAIIDVDAQRVAYLDALETRTNARNVINGGLMVLTAATVFTGIVHTSEETKNVLARYGAIGATAYGLGAYGSSPPTEQAYLLAHLGLTCLVLRTRPWLMPLPEYQELYGSAVATTTPMVALLQTRIDTLDKAHAIAISTVATEHKKHARKETGDISQALFRARKTFRSAQHLKGYVDSAGFQLRLEANLVVSRANHAILREQPGINKPGEGQLGQMANLSAVFQNIKPVEVSNTSGDESSDPESQGAGSTQPPAAAKPSLPSSAKSEAGKAADATEVRVAKLEHDLKALKHIDKNTASTPLLSAPTLAALAAQMADLYAAMRPVTAVLTRIYALKPYVKAVPECRNGQGQVLHLMPDADEVTLAPGATHDITVTGGIGYPRLTLAGTVGKATLTTSLNEGVVKARIDIPSDMHSGEFTLLVRDATDTQSDEVKFLVKGGSK